MPASIEELRAALDAAEEQYRVSRARAMEALSLIWLDAEDARDALHAALWEAGEIWHVTFWSGEQEWCDSFYDLDAAVLHAKRCPDYGYTGVTVTKGEDPTPIPYE